MFRRLAFLVLSAVLCGCSSVALPTQPVTPTTVDTAAYRINLTAATRSDQRLDVAAEVLTRTGAPVVNQSVTFAVTAGSLTAAAGTTDASGMARSIAAVNGSVVITATTSCTGCSATVATFGPPVTSSPIPVPPTPPPALPAPPVASNPTPLVSPLLVSFVNSTQTVNVNTANSLTILATNAIAPLTVTAWTFGDGASDTTNSTTNSHTYTVSGTYTTTASVRDGAGRTATATTTVIVQAPVVSMALSCTAGTVSTHTLCIASFYVTTGQVDIDYIDWNWADGYITTTLATTTGHTIAFAGTYTISVTAHFKDGTSLNRTATIKIV